MDGDRAEVIELGSARDARRVLAALCAVAERSGIAVRIEPFLLSFSGKGGLCRLGGRPVVIVDARLSVVEQVGVVGEALGKLDLRVPRSLRSYVETGHGSVGRLLKLRPLARARP